MGECAGPDWPVITYAGGSPPCAWPGPEAAHNARRLIHAAVEVHGGQHSLHGIAQHTGLFASAAEFLAVVHDQILPETELGSDLAQRSLAYQQLALMGQTALLVRGMRGVEHVTDNELKHCVPEKLQPLIVMVPHGRVGQGLDQQVRAMECIGKPLHERG